MAKFFISLCLLWFGAEIAWAGKDLRVSSKHPLARSLGCLGYQGQSCLGTAGLFTPHYALISYDTIPQIALFGCLPELLRPRTLEPPPPLVIRLGVNYWSGREVPVRLYAVSHGFGLVKLEIPAP